MIRTLLTTTALAAFLSTGVMAQTAPANNTMAPADNMTAPANNTMAPADNTMAPANNAMENAGNTMENAGNAMGNTMENAGNAMGNAMDNAGNAMGNAMDSAGNAMENAGNSMGNTMENAGNSMGNAMESAGNAMSGDTMSGFDMSTGYMVATEDSFSSRMVGADVYSTTGDDAEIVGSVNDLVIGADGSIEAVIIGVGGFLGIGEKNVAVAYSDLEWTTAADGTMRWVLPTTADALTAAPDFVYPDDTNAAAVDTTTTTTDPAAVSETPVTTDPANTTAVDTTATGIDRSTLTPLDMTAMTADDLQGTAVYGPNDEQVGSIGDFVMSSDGSMVDAVIIDVGGFLGIGVKEVAVAYDGLEFSTDENNNRYLFINVTREQLDAQPAFNRDTYQAERDMQLLNSTM